MLAATFFNRKNNNSENQTVKNTLQQQAHKYLTKFQTNHLKSENYKYSHETVTSLLLTNFDISRRLPDEEFYQNHIDRCNLYNINEIRIVFIDGYFSNKLSNIDNLPLGLKINQTKEQGFDRLAQKNLTQLEKNLDVFSAINFLNSSSGVQIEVAANIKIDQPVHLSFISAGLQSSMFNPINLIELGTGSRLVLIEDYLGLNDLAVFSNTVNQIHLNPEAELNHYKIIRQNKNSFHVGQNLCMAEKNSHYSNNLVNVGGKYNRNVLNIEAESKTSIDLQGVYNINEKQIFENHAEILHQGQGGKSNQRYRGIIHDEATGIFRGKITVDRLANKTEAQQLTKTLLMSDDANVFVQPQLEINSDDVKCSHGATVGQIDQKMLFYLLSRGISRNEALKMLTKAFASEIINRFEYMPLRQQLEEMLILKNK